jgi:hypothetical protein
MYLWHPEGYMVKNTATFEATGSWASRDHTKVVQTSAMYLGGGRGFTVNVCIMHAQQGGLTVHAPDVRRVQTRHHPPRHACFSNGIMTSVARLEEWACYERLCAH